MREKSPSVKSWRSYWGGKTPWIFHNSLKVLFICLLHLKYEMTKKMCRVLWCKNTLELLTFARFSHCWWKVLGAWEKKLSEYITCIFNLWLLTLSCLDYFYWNVHARWYSRQIDLFPQHFLPYSFVNFLSSVFLIELGG